jgi:beta-N-acetylhexosaminidase
MKAAIIGIGGTELAASEADLLRRFPPAGVILFARNIANPAQLAELIEALRHSLPSDAVLMVDQEGGRVVRLRPPYWRVHPPAAVIGRVFATRPAAGLRAAWLTGALIGAECAAAGLDVVTAPVLDRQLPGASEVIGDRAYAGDARSVGRLGRAMAAGLLAAGVQPVCKHAPGHGRASVDSHFALPVVDAPDLTQDILPFALNADLPWAMTSHILYPTWDSEKPATLSRTVIGDIIRARIGFNGVLVTDDLAMQALSGVPADHARESLAAGCDIALYCSGEPHPTTSLLTICPEITAKATARLRAARRLAAWRRIELNVEALLEERDRLVA